MQNNHSTSSLLSSLLVLIILTFAPTMASADRNNFEDGNTREQFENTENLRGVDFNWEARMHVRTLVVEPIVHIRGDSCIDRATIFVGLHKQTAKIRSASVRSTTDSRFLDQLCDSNLVRRPNRRACYRRWGRGVVDAAGYPALS
jgi:hypothetical protein